MTRVLVNEREAYSEMSDGLFHLVGKRLVAMRVAPYDAEDVLQEFIEQYPGPACWRADVSGRPTTLASHQAGAVCSRQ